MPEEDEEDDDGDAEEGLGEEEVHSDRFLVSEAMGAGGSRALALEPRFASRGVSPYAAVVAHLLHDGVAPQHALGARAGGGVAAPLPLPTRSGLPVHVVGHFELAPGRGLPLSVPDGGGRADEAMRVEWNRALFACVVAAYAALLVLLPRHVGLPPDLALEELPSSSRGGGSTSTRGGEAAGAVEEEAPPAAPAVPSMYSYWPTGGSVAHEELGRLLLAPLYAALAEAALFLTLPRELEDESRPQRRVLRRLDDGLVCHGSVEPRVGAFVRAHFTVFDIPAPVAEEVLRLAPRGLRPFTAAELRGYLRRKLADRPKREKRLASHAWAPLHSPSFALELLSECARDLPPRGGGGGRVTKASHRDLLDLQLLPLRTGGLAPVGGHATPYLVAGARAQTLLPHLAPRFVHPLCVETAAGAPLFTDAAFVRAANLQLLDLPLLARELRPPPHPPREWLHDFWASAAPLTP